MNFDEERKCLPRYNIRSPIPLSTRVLNCLQAKEGGLRLCGPALNRIIKSNVHFEQRFVIYGKDNEQQRLCVLLTNLITLNLFALITFND